MPATIPRWHPDDTPSGREWRAGQPETPAPADRNLVQWQGSEKGFRITGLKLPANAAVPADLLNRHAWSRVARVFCARSRRVLLQISVSDWTIQRQVRFWPVPTALFTSEKSLLVGYPTRQGGLKAYEVLLVTRQL